jgi:hypothetical protein
MPTFELGTDKGKRNDAVAIKIGTYNIRSGRAGNLEGALWEKCTRCISVSSYWRRLLGNINLPVDKHGNKQNSNGIEADARFPANAVHPNKTSFLSETSVRRTHRYKPPD